MRRFTSLTLTKGYNNPKIGAIKGLDLKDSFIGIRSAMRRVVVKLFPEIRFRRAEMF
jgi:hypothetical protein